MDMDPDIANWLLEYLLKKPIEDRTLNSLLRVLPLPNNPNFIKLILLKKIESEISRNLINESVLEYLEQLEEIEFRQGNESVSDAMKHAYCIVAVQCTVKPLVVGDDGDNSSKHKYFDAVKRLWRGRIEKMMKVVEKGGLSSEELSVWKEQIVEALWEDNVCDSVVNKCKELSAVDAVRAYLIDERERMGPSFLEVVAAKVKDDKVVKQILGVGTTDVVVDGKEKPSNCVDRSKVKDNVIVNEILGMGTTDVVVMDVVEEAPSHVEEAPSRVQEAPSRVEEAPSHVEKVPSRVEKEPSRVEEAPSCVQEAPSRVEEAPSRVEEAPSRVEKEPSRVEKEPSRVEEAPSQSVDRVADVGKVNNKTPMKGKLLDSRRSTRHTSGYSRKANQRANSVDSDEIGVGPSHGNHNSQSSEEVNRVRKALESSAVDLQAVVQDPLPDAIQFAETISGTVKENNVKENNVSDVRNPSLMKRKRSAHTYEWSESIDEPEESGPSNCKPLLPTPRVRAVPPLNRYEMINVPKRRTRKFWSLEEEDTLRAGVKKFGKGNWVAILMAFRDKFNDRTDGDLKDKWRNMSKYEVTDMVDEGTGS